MGWKVRGIKILNIANELLRENVSLVVSRGWGVMMVVKLAWRLVEFASCNAEKTILKFLSCRIGLEHDIRIRFTGYCEDECFERETNRIDGLGILNISDTMFLRGALYFLKKNIK